MKNFEDVSKENELKPWLKTSLGELFYGKKNGRILVRRFPNSELARSYVEIWRAVHDWVRERPNVDMLAAIVLPSEIGGDFVAREHYLGKPTAELLDEDDGENEAMKDHLPPEFFRHQVEIANALNAERGTRQAIIESVIRASLTEPRGKTFFDFTNGKFIVVEPKISLLDIEGWSSHRGE